MRKGHSGRVPAQDIVFSAGETFVLRDRLSLPLLLPSLDAPLGGLTWGSHKPLFQFRDEPGGRQGRLQQTFAQRWDLSPCISL